jgi:hypothetical protein
MNVKNQLFGFDNITDKEAILFSKVCQTNGDDNEQILKELDFIENWFSFKKVYVLTAKATAKTKSGYLRKNHALLDHLNLLIETQLEPV